MTEKEKLADREFIAKEMELMRLEDQQFEEYATNVIDYMAQHGRNVYPMKKVNIMMLYIN
jgi:hypothetical protein